jgi:hypothetical protein
LLSLKRGDPHSAEHLLAFRRHGDETLRIQEVHHLVSAEQIATLLHNVHITAEHHPAFFTEVLSLPGRRHNPLIGVDDPNVTRGRYHTGGLICLLQIGLDGDKARVDLSGSLSSGGNDGLRG